MKINSRMASKAHLTGVYFIFKCKRRCNRPWGLICENDLVSIFSGSRDIGRGNLWLKEKSQFPEKSSNFRHIFVALINITGITSKGLFIRIKIRPNLRILVTLIGRYRVNHENFNFYDKSKSVGWGQNLAKWNLRYFGILLIKISVFSSESVLICSKTSSKTKPRK